MGKRVFKVKMPPGSSPEKKSSPATRFTAGIDVHKYHVTACVAVRQEQGEAIERVSVQEFKTDPRGLDTLAKFLAKYPLEAVVMEATGVYSTPVREALEKYKGWSHHPLILTFNPTEVKHFPGELHEDKADAFSMAKFALMGLLRASFIPEGTLREIRELTREASVLTKESTRAKSRIKRVLAAWGLALPHLDLSKNWAIDLFRALDWSGGDFGKAIKAIKSGEFSVPAITRNTLAKRDAEYIPFETVVIPPAIHGVLRGYMLSLAASEALIARFAGEVEEIIVRCPSIEMVVNQLAQIDGITPFSAASIVAEVGDIGRFRTVKQFLAYAGCAPQVHQSGTKTLHGKLTRRANPYLKRKFFLIGMLISTTVKRDSDLKAYAMAQRQRHPSKLATKLVWANTGAKVARVVFAILRTCRPYQACHTSNAQLSAGSKDQVEAVPAPFSLRDLRRRSKQFVNYINRFQADAPAKFRAVADAFGKITWA